MKFKIMINKKTYKFQEIIKYKWARDKFKSQCICDISIRNSFSWLFQLDYT